MRRYGKLIAIITVVVLTIGTFYVQSALSAGRYPEVVMKEVKGDEKEANPVTLYGQYSVASGMNSAGVRVTSDGSTYEGERSFFDRIQRGYYSEEIRQLQEKYRSFMRGKRSNVASYLETEDTLAYAGVRNQSVRGSDRDMEFDISVLDKADDETTSFTMPVPNRAMYNSVIIEDVQMLDGELNVMTQNYLRNGGNATYVYQIDISEQEITGEDTIASAEEQDENTNVSMRLLASSDILGDHNYVLFAKTTEPVVRQSSNRQGNVSEQISNEGADEYIVYNLKTGEKKSLALPESLKGKDDLFYENTTLYFTDDNISEITRYNFETGNVEGKLDIPSENIDAMQQESTPAVEIANGKMYLLTRPNDPASTQNLIVMDTESGDVLYEGEVTTNGSVDQENTLLIYDMSVQ